MKNWTSHKVAAPVLQVKEALSLEEQIAPRAHELWQQRGRQHGSDLTDWLRAEREVNERLYPLVVATLALMGGGRFSLDARLESQWPQAVSKHI